MIRKVMRLAASKKQKKKIDCSKRHQSRGKLYFAHGYSYAKKENTTSPYLLDGEQITEVDENGNLQRPFLLKLVPNPNYKK